MDRELVLVCQECDRRIWGGFGYLWADTTQVAHVGQARRDWEAKHSDGPVDLLNFLSYPEPAPWQAHHQACDPDREGAHYRLASQKLRTGADLLRWTAHLMGKNWLHLTDWSDLIQEALQGGRRIAVPELRNRASRTL
ncbi:hypothetical protein [Streptomyces sp. NPDC026589]|uniref:hypothetical protein n=1 Tax=Streptomyces sp. NPDC026589 TaxID=3155609 RepID=UPI0033D358CD